MTDHHHDLEHQQDLPTGSSHLRVDPAGANITPPNGPAVRRKQLSVDDYVQGVLAGDRAILGRAITLIESNSPKHQALAREVLTRLMPRTGNAIRVGITGVPGAGKSTFIETLGSNLTAQGKRVAVLAVDPTSSRTGGSILGDKTRMAKLANDPAAFIRPSPAGQTLGGVAGKTRETMLICEAAGFDVLLIETVGVGQSETVVAEMTDFFLVLMIAGGGDELQGIKRGVIELADLIAINKADGDNVARARKASRDYANALHYMIPHDAHWRPKVHTCSAMTNQGVTPIWDRVEEHHQLMTDNGILPQRRREQTLKWMWHMVDDRLRWSLRHHPEVVRLWADVERDVREGHIPPTLGAVKLLEAFGIVQ